MAKITTSLFGVLELCTLQWQNPAVETLEYLSDVFQAFDGTEARLQLRSAARQKYQVDLPSSFDKIASTFNSQYNALRAQWALPIWTEAQFVGQLAAGLTVITCDTVYHDLRANSLAFIVGITGASMSWQIVEISSITANSITVSSGIEAMTNAYILPVRLAHITGDITNTTNGYNTNSKIVFQIDDYLASAGVIPTQYEGSDLYFDSSLIGNSDLTKNFNARQDIVDYNLGIISYRSPWLNVHYGSQFNKIMVNAEEVFNFKAFFARCGGKYRSFWKPTDDYNFEVQQTGLLASEIVFATNGFADYAPRTNAAIKTLDGQLHPFQIVSSSQINDTQTNMVINTELNFDASTITNFSYIGLNRLDTDSVDLTWNGNGEVETSYNILELTA
jgi:hypothetical protein